MTERDGEQHPAAIPWRVDRRDGVNPRRIRAGARTIAYGTTVADAERIARTGETHAMLVTALEIARDVLAGHAPEFIGREAVIRLITTAIAYGKGGRP
jgi:hypothetical protein